MPPFSRVTDSFKFFLHILFSFSFALNFIGFLVSREFTENDSFSLSQNELNSEVSFSDQILRIVSFQIPLFAFLDLSLFGYFSELTRLFCDHLNDIVSLIVFDAMDVFLVLGLNAMQQQQWSWIVIYLFIYLHCYGLKCCLTSCVFVLNFIYFYLL